MAFIKNRAIIYNGPSKLDGAPIICVAVGGSSNRKTGNMIQLHIIRSDISPVEAKNTGKDTSICGICPVKKECYVNVGQGPNAVYKAFSNGRYEDISNDLEKISKFVSGKMVRFGAYGDIAALPFDLCKLIVEYAKGHTAYTHQRKHKNYDFRFNTIAHISTETAKEAFEVSKIGLGNTFRIVSDYSHKLNHELICPSENGVECIDCGMCKGSTGKSIVIKSHGRSGKKLAKKLDNHSKPDKSMLIPVINIEPVQVDLF